MIFKFSKLDFLSFFRIDEVDFLQEDIYKCEAFMYCRPFVRQNE